jgi:ADP-heptose:LPS heptosyltransferase
VTTVLFVRLSAMGDLVHGLGAVAALHAVRPEWRLVFATQAEFAPLLRSLPGIAAVVGFDRAGGLPALLALRRALRREACDVALDLQGNWKSALVAFLSAARRCIGMAARWRQASASRLLLHETIDAEGTPHPARAAWELVRRLAPEAPFLRPELRATPDELAAEAAALRSLGIDVGRPFTVVVVTDRRDPRALSPAMVAALCDPANGPAVAVYGPAEVGLPPVESVPCLRHGLGEVRRLIALGSLVAAAGGSVVGPDQGATHVLAAAGARCRVVFGAQDPRRTAPVAAEALVHPEPPACAPCRRRSCRHPAGAVCMEFPLAAARVVQVELPPAGPSFVSRPGA